MSAKTVFVTGADRGVGFALCKIFLEKGWQVFAGRYLTDWKDLDELKEEYPDALRITPLDVSKSESIKAAALAVAGQTDHIDMLINCAGIYGSDSREKMRAIYKTNTLGPLCMTEAFLPLMENGQKRLCYFSSEAGSIANAFRKNTFGYCMSKTSLNMAVKLIFNDLRKDGYLFRLYHPGWVKSFMNGNVKSTEGLYEPEETAAVAYELFTGNRDWEDVLALTDVEQEIWPF